METTVAPQGTDPSTVPPPAPKQAPATEPQPKETPRVDMTPAQLKERLEEERAKGEKRAADQFAKDLGIPLDEAKRLIADAKAKDDAAKSEVQRLTEQLTAERQRRHV